MSGLASVPGYAEVTPTTDTPGFSQSIADMLCLSNNFVELHPHLNGRDFSGLTFVDKINGRTYELGPDVFKLGFEYSTVNEDPDAPKTSQEKETRDKSAEPSVAYVSARDLQAGAPIVEDLPANPNARRLVDRRAGKRITIPFACIAAGPNNLQVGNGTSIKWTAEIHEGLPYVRITVTTTSENFAALPVREVRVLDFAAPDAKVEGSVQGAPVSALGGRLFAGVESPLSVNKAEDGRITTQLNRKLDTPGGSPLAVSAVLGVSAPGQLRRTFQMAYINEERARPYGAFLNYNTWYDIGYFDEYDEKKALDVVNTYGNELAKKRGVVIDSFLMDDGWDDRKTLWQFHSGFPHEFANVRKAAESFGAGPGVWFSPWGGYGQPKDDRIKAAEGKFETNDSGFSLAGPKYYQHFKNMCIRMIKENGINHFKFDGTSGNEQQTPGSKFSSDFEAIISLINELREVRSDLYVNLTTGTWASPFWFGIADSIWRGNWDHAFYGEGSHRNMWITFRDANIYTNNVAVSPLFPINSLMTHGVIYTKRAKNLTESGGIDLINEIWSGFGSGTQMQEIYVSPSLLTQEEWDTLAAAAKWARANNDTLVDTHWVGGDPTQLQVYGWAAWSPAKGIVTLRNPASVPQTWSLEASAAFELPAGAPVKYTLSSPKGDQLPAETIEAGKPLTITLQPFQVIVLEATPVK